MMLHQAQVSGGMRGTVKLRLSLIPVETGGSVEATSSRETIISDDGPI
jgi:hypothetical protein